MTKAVGRAGERRLLCSLRELLGLRRYDPKGRWGEREASRFLEDAGYEILERNYRVRGGEADLICGKDGLVIVVEVKSRRSSRFGTAAQAVTRRKARRVLSAGRAFCRKRGISLSRLRGDVVTVEEAPSSGEPVIRHLPGGLGGA